MTALILLKDFLETQIEIWKYVEGCDGYEVSNLGRVRSFLGTAVKREGRGRVSARLSTPHFISLSSRTSKKPNKAYVTFNYRKKPDGPRVSTTVHAIVARAFLPRPFDCNQVNHKNGIKIDNRAANLEWSNTQKNQEHANLYLVRRGERNYNSRITDAQARRVKELRKEGWQLKKIALFLDISLNTVEQISAGSRWRHISDD